MPGYRDAEMYWSRYGAPAVVVAVAGMAISSGALGHGGGLDDRGCHRNASVGNYHCHQGPHAGKTFPSKATYGRKAAGGARDEGGAYNRDDYMRRWRDADGDCQDTRQEVLIAESEVPVEFATNQRCKVVAGEWHDPFTGRTFTDPSKLDIDHMVPLKEAHSSGAANWPNERKRAYANDLEHPHTLIAVERGANRSKGSRDPADWMPPNEDFRCRYLGIWVEVKEMWGLAMDPEERTLVRSSLEDCGDW